MGVRVTEIEGKAALFDSTTNLAFGPIFDSASEAEEFLNWLAEKEKNEETFPLLNDQLFFKADPRVYRLGEFEVIVQMFREGQEGKD
jgi:hypothetical protein